MSETVYRCQDEDGRGPWRPGLSRLWMTDEDTPERDALLPWMEEFGPDVLKLVKPSEHVGCGCRTLGQLWRWFTVDERGRLRNLGFAFVQMQADRVLAESDVQLVFARSMPLNRGVIEL